MREMKKEVANSVSGEPVRTHQKVNQLTAYLYLLMALYAVSMTMLGPLMPSVIEAYDLRLSQGGLIMTVQSVGGVLAIFFGSLAADRLPKAGLFGVSFLAFAAALILVGLIDIYAILLVIFFVLGAGSRMSDTVLNAYISDIQPSRRGFYLNLLHTFFGVGAFAGPIYVRFMLIRGWAWNQVFGMLGIVCLALILLLPFFTRRPKAQRQDASHTKKQDKPHLFAPYLVFKTSFFIWLICLIMFLYVGHQSILVTWIPMYMEGQLRTDANLAGLGLSLLWLGIIAGRFGGAYLIEKVRPLGLIMGGSLLGALILAAGLFSQIPALILIALALCGLLTGGTIPQLVTIACDRYPAYSGAASSLIFLSGSFATMFFPWFAGLLAETVSFSWAMAVSWLTLLCIGLLCVALRSSLQTAADA